MKNALSIALLAMIALSTLTSFSNSSYAAEPALPNLSPTDISQIKRFTEMNYFQLEAVEMKLKAIAIPVCAAAGATDLAMTVLTFVPILRVPTSNWLETSYYPNYTDGDPTREGSGDSRTIAQFGGFITSIVDLVWISAKDAYIDANATDNQPRKSVYYQESWGLTDQFNQVKHNFDTLIRYGKCGKTLNSLVNFNIAVAIKAELKKNPHLLDGKTN